MEMCSFGGCDLKCQARGLCSSHYGQVRRGNPLKPLHWRSNRGCDFPGCDHPHKAKGLCKSHGSQLSRGKTLVPLRRQQSGSVCDFPGCGKKHHSNGLCATHYQQRAAGHPLAPIYSTRNKNGMGQTKEKKASYNKHWRLDHPERIRAYRHKRRAHMQNSEVEDFLDGEIFERDNWICQLCFEPIDQSLKWPDSQSKSLDHIIPVSKMGSHTRDNVQIAHVICNLRKGNRT